MNSSGIRTMALICFSAILLFSCRERHITVPVAKFSYSPATGAMDTIFTFDASASTDGQDHCSCLEVRWDWDADGIWDTDFSTEKIASHRFTKFLDNAVILEVRDKDGISSYLKSPISITDSGTITGMDPRMCVCCGGWWIRIQNDTLRFYDAPENVQAMLNKAVFPMDVTVKWAKKVPRCMGDEIVVYDLKLR